MNTEEKKNLLILVLKNCSKTSSKRYKGSVCICCALDFLWTRAIPTSRQSPKMTQVLNNPAAYTFSSQPRALQQRKKYKDQWTSEKSVGSLIAIELSFCSIDYFTFASADDESKYGNIMYDRRVIRGNTYALHTLPAVSFDRWFRRA